MAVVYRVERKKILRNQTQLASWMVGLIEKACEMEIRAKKGESLELLSNEFKQNYLEQLEEEKIGNLF